MQDLENNKAAIYHFTDESKKRPEVYKKQLRALEAFAVENGLEVTDVFCDMSLRKVDGVEFKRFMSNCENYNALVTKDFYHISKNTGKCLGTLRELRSKGLTVYTIENGCFRWTEADFDKPLKVATYFCYYGTENENRDTVSLKNDVFSLFVEKKTNWTLVDMYQDEALLQINGEQPNLQELIANSDKYDLLLVHNMNDIHRRTTAFCKVREALKLDIYSLQEGFLAYR